MNKKVVNATALRGGGALTILKQFVDAASKDSRDYIFFVSPGLNLPTVSNIRFVEINTISWFKRIIWDWFKLKKWLHKNNINYDLIISLQNTSVCINAPQIIYLHQPLPFTKINLEFNRFEDLKLLLYKRFYAFISFVFTKKDTKFVVQTNWMKESLIKDFNINPKQIFQIMPNIVLPKSKGSCGSNTYFQIFYPASPISYKNHLIILQALHMLFLEKKINDIVFSVTFQRGDYPQFDHMVNIFKLDNNINYIGVVKYEQVIELYLKSNLIVFPSYIETFGFPLIEAASLGKEIICSKQEFSLEVLEGYDGATFLPYDKPSEWASALEVSYKKRDKIISYNQSKVFKSSSWDEFFSLF